jgi:hypothetical protein
MARKKSLARIRTIKPEYWTDERVGECSVSARLLFIATWNFADDEGGLERSAKQLKAQAFPYDQIECEPFIQELLQVGLLVEYEVDGKKYLHIKGFGTHQKIEKKARPRFPVYHSSPPPPLLLPLSSVSSAVSSLGRESKGREGKGEREVRAARSTLATRLPADFGLTPERRAIAEAEKADPDREFAQFTDHFRAAPGVKGRKNDWDAAWRNWCRRAPDFKPKPRFTTGHPEDTGWRPPPDEKH